MDNYTIDGHAFIDGKHLFFEFLGCWAHPGCEFCGNGGYDKIWQNKKKLLEKIGTLITMRECVWTKKTRDSQYKTAPIPQFPLLMNRFGNSCEIIRGIEDDMLFGFIVCDVSTPDEIIEKYLWLNFPPGLV